ncbi:MAG TPA: imidazolonepropionase, partial [Candidatus Limnocylindria bacterium]|nr:imidazolonepropionase [Candidatus Limnocylindria bacterium]
MTERGGVLLTGSGRLCLARPGGTPAPRTLSPWAVLVGGERIAWVGPPEAAPAGADERVDLGEALVTPALVDTHTHPVFAGDRSDEAAARLAGAPYSEGGILRTVAATRAATDEELLDAVEGRLRAQLAAGVTTVECKSGYGLSLAEELRALRLIGRAAERVGIRVRRTLLAAHAVPPEANGLAEYAEHVANEIVPAAAAEGLADFCDVFCDAGFFDLASTERIAASAARRGLGIRLHAEQLRQTGAAELGVRLGAVSVDH